MPTYTCTTQPGALDEAQRIAIAEAITRLHADITGAPGCLVQVVFDERPHRFIGGTPCDTHLMVRGDIRAGRTRDQRTALLEGIVRAVAAILGTAAGEIWVYLNELSPSDMVEFGQVLPEPGEEKAWLERLPESRRAANDPEIA